MNVPKLRFKEFNDEWNRDKIGNFVIINSGDSPSKFEFYNQGIPYYKVEQLNNCLKYQVQTPYYINTNKVIPKGSIIFPKRGAAILLNKIRILNLDSFFDTNIMSLTTNGINNEFLYYYLIKENLSNIADTSSIPQLNNKHIEPYPLIYPRSSKEQEMVGKTLQLLDKKIELQTKKIEDLKLFKKGLFNTIKNLNCDSEYLLSDIVTFENGKGHESIVDENGKYILVNSKFISTEGKVIKKCSEQLCPLKENDIVMVMSDLPNGKALSKCFYINENNKYSLNQRICLLRANENIDSKYLFYKINRNPYYLKFDDGVNQTNLKKNDILNLVVNLPSLSYQKKYSKIMTSFDKKINAEENYLNKLFELKKGLMQNMFV